MKNTKMLFWTVVLIIICYLLSMGVSVNSLNSVVEKNDEELSKVLTSKVYDTINNILTEPIMVAQTMASDYYLTEPLSRDDFPSKEEEEKLVRYLSTISKRMNYNSVFVVSEKSRVYYTQEGFNKFVSPETDSHDVWYSLFVDSGKNYDFDVDTDEVHDNEWTVFVNCRIEDSDHELLGACGVSVVMTELQDILQEYEREYNVKINLINDKGLVQVDTDAINIENKVLDVDISDVTGTKDYVYKKTGDGGYSVSKYVEKLGWYLVVQSDGEGNGKIYSSLIFQNICIFFLILFGCVFMVSTYLSIEKKKMDEDALNKERYAKEQEVLKAQAEQASKAKGEFLANMSHEIRTPINAVLGMDEMILRESTEPKILEYAGDIRRAGKTLLSLINDILDFSKIESGKMNLNPSEYDLGIVFGELYDMICVKAKKENLQLTFDIAPDTPAHLYGDEVRIRQILTNILTNAVKYTHEGGVTLKVSSKKISEDTVQLFVSVKDTGIGIRKEDQERLFDSFQRLDESKNRNIEGTGLGLSITMRLLDLMGSKLSLESTYGEGSEFYFYLEQKLLDTQTIGDMKQYYEYERKKIVISGEKFLAPDARILVVDDNEMNLKVFLGLLKNHGMQIDTAICGKDCLSRMQERSYHIIFMDHLMPEMDGVETMKQAKSLPNNLSKDAIMIALTANSVAGAREMFLAEGFDDYLEKPIIANKLEQMILNYLPEEIILREVQEPADIVESEMAAPSEPGGNGEQVIIDWEMGKKFCAGDDGLYREILKTFLESASDSELQKFFDASDFQNYRIKVHAMKTNLANVGAVEVSEVAKKLELALKNENDEQYVKKHHEEFMILYQLVVDAVEEYLKQEEATDEI